MNVPFSRRGYATLTLPRRVAAAAKRMAVVVVGAVLMSGGSWAWAQTPTSKPAAKPSVVVTDAEIEAAGTLAFNRGDYANALPLLKKTAEKYKDNPDKLGPVQERIRVATKAIALANVQKNAVAVDPTTPDNTPRKPHPAPEEGKVQEMAIKDLGNFDYDADKGGNIPDDVKKLSGSMVRLHGYMIPIDQAERISKFALVPSLFACCFGQPPQIQHIIIVECPAGKAVSYYPDELSVEGKLTVDEKKEDGVITSVFQLTTTSVKPAAK